MLIFFCPVAWGAGDYLKSALRTISALNAANPSIHEPFNLAQNEGMPGINDVKPPSSATVTRSPSPSNPTSPPSFPPFDGQMNGAVREFINRIAIEEQVDWTIIQALLSQAVWVQKSLDLTNPAPASPYPVSHPKRDWLKYRARFLTPERIAASKKFMIEYREDLEQAEKIYGVPATVVVAILNIESRLGEQAGRYRTLDVLSTLAFYHSSRSVFYQEQLASLIKLWRRDHINILQLQGSYAGAVGMAQFIPSSVLAYAVDFDGDGELNLYHPADAIGSVAKFLAKHGWRRSEGAVNRLISIPSSMVATIGEATLQDWLKEGSKPSLERETLIKAGVSQDIVSRITPPVALIDLPNAERAGNTAYRLGSFNYFVITRYNRSYDYATAVHELSQAIIAK